MYGPSHPDQSLRQLSFETQSKMVLQLWHERLLLRQREQERFNTAIEVPAVYVQHSKVSSPAGNGTTFRTASIYRETHIHYLPGNNVTCFSSGSSRSESFRSRVCRHPPDV